MSQKVATVARNASRAEHKVKVSQIRLRAASMTAQQDIDWKQWQRRSVCRNLDGIGCVVTDRGRPDVVPTAIAAIAAAVTPRFGG